MILTIDIGNSNIVVGGFNKGGELMFCSRLATDKARTEDQYAIEIKDILRLYDTRENAFSGAIISSVVPPLTNTLSAAAQKLIGKTPMILGPGTKTGLDIKIDNPAVLGSDIVANSVAAINKYPKPLITIDMGTATKISYISKNGAFQGCAIMPGVRIAIDALSERTAQLPFVSIEASKSVLGTNTIDSMRSGVVFGAASMIDGMIERIRDEKGAVKAIVSTGGLSEEITKNCKNNIIHDSNLLIEGLYLIYNKNQKQEIKL